MATRKSIALQSVPAAPEAAPAVPAAPEGVLVCPLQLRAATDASCAAYELALELSVLLEVFDELPNPPNWAFALSRSAVRAMDQADLAHHQVRRLAPQAKEAL